jgi:hypothetical protein
VVERVYYKQLVRGGTLAACVRGCGSVCEARPHTHAPVLHPCRLTRAAAPLATCCINPLHPVSCKQAARSERVGRRLAADVSESGDSGGSYGSDEGTSGLGRKPSSAKKRANPRKPSHPMRALDDDGDTGSDAKRVRCVGLRAARLALWLCVRRPVPPWLAHLWCLVCLLCRTLLAGLVGIAWGQAAQALKGGAGEQWGRRATEHTFAVCVEHGSLQT